MRKRGARAIAAWLVAVLGLGLLATGCGSDGDSPVPRGSPDARHGAAAVDAYGAIELLRAMLVASSDSYYAGGAAADAESQLERAAAAYSALAAEVTDADPVLAREVAARFTLLARELRRGVGPDRYRDLADPLTDQLMEGVKEALVPADARTDRGLQGEVLRRLTARLAAIYGAAAGSVGDARSRLAFEEAWGLWRRSLALTAALKDHLGDQRDAIAGTLNDLREPAFPDGPLQVDDPPAQRVERAAARVADALHERFRL